jgi:hypothetical protein
MQKSAAIALIAGSIMFLASIFSPAIAQQFQATSPEQIVALIEGDRTGWVLTQALFVAGPIIAGAGALLLARHLGRLAKNAAVRWIALAGSLFIFIAALGMLVQFYRLVAYPAEEIAAEMMSDEGGIPLLFGVYTVLTLSGLIALGYALLMTGYAKALAFFVIGTMALALIGFFVTGDTLPLYQYVVMTIMGLALLFVRPRVSSAQPEVSEQAA